MMTQTREPKAYPKEKARFNGATMTSTLDANPVLPAEESICLLTFKLGPKTYGIEYSYVREVSPFVRPSQAPCFPAFVREFIRVRGRGVLLFNLRAMFGLSFAPFDPCTRVVILQRGETEYGFLADEVHGFMEVPSESLQTLAYPSDTSNSQFHRGITTTGMVLLDGEKLLTSLTRHPIN